MVERPKDELLDHEYDGIREFDNPCPAWWHLIFIGSVVFSGFYWVFFHLGPSLGTNGWSVTEAYEQAKTDNLQLQFAELGELTVDEPTLLRYMQPPDTESGDARDWLAIGASVFKTHCKSCHAEDGSGLVGPNLTDDHYKNVKELIDIARVIENGAANGSMPAWQNRLIPNEIVLVSAYVANLRGKDLPGRKPEGEVISPWPDASSGTDEAEPAAPDDATSRDQEAASGPEADAAEPAAGEGQERASGEDSEPAQGDAS
jgi:cytochrome c oxidase cbb3-type subunit 3